RGQAERAATSLAPRSACPLPSSLLLAGLFSGLAAATKYNCLLVLLAPMAAIFLEAPRPFPWPRIVATQIGLVGAAVLGFLLGCPGALLNGSQFQKDVLFE